MKASLRNQCSSAGKRKNMTFIRVYDVVVLKIYQPVHIRCMERGIPISAPFCGICSDDRVEQS